MPVDFVTFFQKKFVFDEFYTSVFQLVNPHNKDIRDIPGLAPPAMNRKLLWNAR
jgi:hypothetical protein